MAEVALACGRADQSYLTRLFSRTEGLPPRAWRRMLRDCARHTDPRWPARGSEASPSCRSGRAISSP
ncbi:hypothetical protein [Bradyrhizobium aeschynomenes]|uniref:hypothetical protein n=1 Tax=Bradyrhizobium aeschynomenes TaxID=2734909 RepID=UPI0035E17AEB